MASKPTSKPNEFRRALIPMHRCEFFRNTWWDMFGEWPLMTVIGWRKDCPCRKLKRAT